MKKHITPENYLLIQAMLFIYTMVFIEYNLRTFAFFLAAMQILLLGFIAWYVGWKQPKDEKRKWSAE